MCRVSQPAVTTGVARLERALGGKLFERRHPVRLTAFGAQLQPLLAALQMAGERVTATVAQLRSGADERADTGKAFISVTPQEPACTVDTETGEKIGSDHQSPSLEVFALDANMADPGQPLIQQLGKSYDLFARSRIAIEQADRAIEKFLIARDRAGHLPIIPRRNTPTT